MNPETKQSSIPLPCLPGAAEALASYLRSHPEAAKPFQTCLQGETKEPIFYFPKGSEKPTVLKRCSYEEFCKWVETQSK